MCSSTLTMGIAMLIRWAMATSRPAFCNDEQQRALPLDTLRTGAAPALWPTPSTRAAKSSVSRTVSSAMWLSTCASTPWMLNVP